MRSNVDFVVVIVHVFASVSSALQRGDNFMFGELFLQVLESKLVFLDSLSLDNEAVVLLVNVWNCEVVSDLPYGTL